MKNVINMKNWLNNKRKTEEYMNKISYHVNRLLEHEDKYNYISKRKIVMFKKLRLNRLKDLIECDKQEIEQYTRLYCA